MRDRFFYPLLVLVLVGIVALALFPGRPDVGISPIDAERDGFVLAGDNLQRLTSAPGTVSIYTSGVDGKVLYATLSTNLPKDMAPASAGVFETLNVIYERAFAGQDVNIMITARAGTPNALEQFQVAYFAASASSGWREFVLTPEFKTFSFTFKVPEKSGVEGRNYIGIWPGEEGRGQTVDVQSIKIKLVKP